VFRLHGTERLLELPMSIMDSALFFPGRMGLSPQEALQPCRRILSHAQRFGGTVVVNWHDRSLAPERLWGRAYTALLELMNGHRTWFATAADAVQWFRWRRSICFGRSERAGQGLVNVSAAAIARPAGLIRRYRAVSGRVEIDEGSFDGGASIGIETGPVTRPTATRTR